jgi:hypothetical protein
MTRPITELDAWELASLANCGEPDNSASPGAMFLAHVRDAFTDARERGETDPDGDWLHELADSAVPVYTHSRWLTFVDLNGWEVDASDFGDDVSADALTEHAGVVLYVIAENVLHALVHLSGGDAA